MVKAFREKSVIIGEGFAQLTFSHREGMMRS
jgi:hypothetical protein